MKHIRLIRQTSPTECGLNCIYMLMSYYGCNEPFFKFKSRWGVGRDGLSYLNLKMIAMNYGFSVKAYELNNGIHKTPAIVHVTGNHFIVVEKCKLNKYWIVDPQVGKYKTTFEELKKKNPNKYMVIEKENSYDSNSSTMGKPNNNLFKMFTSKINKKELLKLLSVSFCTQFSVFLIPFFIKWVIDSYTETKDLQKIIIIVLLLMMLLQISIVYFMGLLSNRIQSKFIFELASGMIENISGWSMQTIKKMNIEDLLSRYNGLEMVRKLLSGKVISLCINVIIIFMCLMYILSASLLISVLLIILTIIEGIAYYLLLEPRKTKLDQEVSTENESVKMFNLLSENLETLKANNAESNMEKIWQKKFKEYLEISRRRSNLNHFLYSIQDSQTLFIPIITIILFISIKSTFSTGELVALFLIVSNYITQLNLTINTITEINCNWKYFEGVMTTKEIPQEISNEKLIDRNSILPIELENVNYRYDNFSPLVLKNISLRIKDGDFIAIIGKSGSGKTTLGNMLISYIDPEKGKVTYGKINYDVINKTSLRDHVAYLSQKNDLIAGTIRYNIILGNPKISERDIERVCRQMELNSEIQFMPMKFATILSQKRSNLSMGQIQRIKLAKIIVKKPKIVILDEPMSSIDIVSEHIISEKIEELSCTKILITHRLNTIRHANHIVMMEDGEIIANGTHEELYIKIPKYKKEFDSYMETYTKNLSHKELQNEEF